MEDDDNDPTEEADVKKALKRLFGDYVDRSQKEIFEYRSEASEVVTRLDREIHAAVQKSWSKVAAECPSTVFRQSDGEVKVGAGAAAVSFSVGDLPSSFGTAAGATAIGAAIGSVIPGVGTLVGAGLGLLWSAIFGNAREEACEKIVEVVNEQIEKLDLSIDQAWEVQIDAANQGVVDVFNTRWEAYSSAMELLDQELEKRQAEAERRQRLVAKVLKESNRVARELSATG
jgi:hypothetical protein